MQEAAVKQESKGLRIAFGILATLGGLAGLVFTVPLALPSMGSGPDSIHRIHNVVGLFTFGVFIGLAVMVAAWRPATQIAAFQAVLVATVASTAVALLAGDFISGSYWPGGVIVVILVALHPARRELFRNAPPIWPLVILALASIVPAVLYALSQASLQRDGVMADPHVELHHFSGIAASALGLMLGSF